MFIPEMDSRDEVDAGPSGLMTLPEDGENSSGGWRNEDCPISVEFSAVGWLNWERFESPGVEIVSSAGFYGVFNVFHEQVQNLVANC